MDKENSNISVIIMLVCGRAIRRSYDQNYMLALTNLTRLVYLLVADFLVVLRVKLQIFSVGRVFFLAARFLGPRIDIVL